MNNQKLTGKQMKYVIALFIIGSSLATGTSAKAGQDSWISIIIAALFAVPLIFVYDAILRLYPGENLFDIMIHIFGNILGKIFCLIYVLFALHLASLVINIFTEFIHAVTMPETPKIVLSSFLILTCVFMVYCGITAMGRVAKFLFPIFAAAILLTIVTSYQIYDFNNLKPILNTDLSTLMDSSLTSFALPFGELIILTTIFSCVDKKENYKKIFIQGLVIGFLFLLIDNLRNLLILGHETIKMFPYPSYEAVSIIAIGEFFTRIEVIVGASLFLAGFMKIVVCCFSCCEGLAKIFNIQEYKFIAAPIALLMVTLSSFAFKNTVDMLKFVEYYKIIVIPYQVILPLIILITGKIKMKMKKNKSNNGNTAYSEEI